MKNFLKTILVFVSIAVVISLGVECSVHGSKLGNYFSDRNKTDEAMRKYMRETFNAYTFPARVLIGDFER